MITFSASGAPVVVEEFVVCSDLLVQLSPLLLYDSQALRRMGYMLLFCLEENVRVV